GSRALCGSRSPRLLSQPGPLQDAVPRGGQLSARPLAPFGAVVRAPGPADLSRLQLPARFPAGALPLRRAVVVGRRLPALYPDRGRLRAAADRDRLRRADHLSATALGRPALAPRRPVRCSVLRRRVAA